LHLVTVFVPISEAHWETSFCGSGAELKLRGEKLRSSGRELVTTRVCNVCALVLSGFSAEFVLDVFVVAGGGRVVVVRVVGVTTLATFRTPRSARFGGGAGCLGRHRVEGTSRPRRLRPAKAGFRVLHWAQECATSSSAGAHRGSSRSVVWSRCRGGGLEPCVRNMAPPLLFKFALPPCKVVPLRFAALPLRLSPSPELFGGMRGRFGPERWHPQVLKALKTPRAH